MKQRWFSVQDFCVGLASANFRLAVPNFDWALLERMWTLPERKIARSSPLAIFCAAQNFRSGRRDHQRWPSVYGGALAVPNFCSTVVNGYERWWIFFTAPGTLQQRSGGVTGTLIFFYKKPDVNVVLVLQSTTPWYRFLWLYHAFCPHVAGGRGNPNKCPRFTNHDEACRVVDVANLGHEDHTYKS